MTTTSTPTSSSSRSTAERVGRVLLWIAAYACCRGWTAWSAPA